MANKILFARGTKARIETIKGTLETYEVVYATDTGELGVKKANGDIEYFKNAADIDAIVTGKQDKLVAGDNITIDPTTNVISASGGGGDGVDLDTMGYMNHASKIYYDSLNQDKFKSAWEHSLTVTTPNITSYPNGSTEGVIIPNSVTNIEDAAFYGWSFNNKPLVIPNSVTSIGNSSFMNWSGNNQQLVIPNSLTSITDGAFYSWPANNQQLVIPNSVTSIENNAFYGWAANKQPLTIPNSVTSIGNNTFGNWSSAKEFIMESETPPTITSTSFANTNNAPFYVPNDSVDDYKTATNWVSLADRIFPMSDR